MTKEEYRKLTEEYTKTFREYNDYMEGFFTSYIDNRLEHEAIRYFTDLEIIKTEEMKKNLDELEERWFKIANGAERLTD